MNMSEKQDKVKAIVFRINDHGQGPELLRQVFLEKGWVEFNEDTQEENDWNLWWRTSRFRNSDYENICPWQRLNHYPKSTGITKKDCLARNMKRMKGVHGAGVYNFNPLAFNLPNDYTRFVAEYGRLKQNANDASKLMWICKPADLSRGRGIFIFRDISELQYDCNAVVQRYIPNPMLIGGYKFDMRVYVAVPSFHPLTIYVHEEGLVRFGTEKFDLNALHNVFAHLTNTSINKHSPGYTTDKERIGPGCKWTITQLRQYLHQHNINDNIMWIRIINIIILTLLVQAPQVSKTSNCFELYGFDILVDESLKPWLLEVNFSPALSFDCQADITVKKPMLHDLLSMMNFKESDCERGFTHSPQKALRGYERIERLSSASVHGRNAPGIRKSNSNVPKTFNNISKQNQPVKPSVSYLDHDHSHKPSERPCFGLPLVTPGDDRPGSSSSGLSSGHSEDVVRAESRGPDTGLWTNRSLMMRTNTSYSLQLVGQETYRQDTYRSESILDNNLAANGNVMHTPIGPLRTGLERSITMSSVVRRADYPQELQGSQAMTDVGSINSTSTTDSGISSNLSTGGSENEGSHERPQKGVIKLLPHRSKSNHAQQATSRRHDTSFSSKIDAYQPTKKYDSMKNVSTGLVPKAETPHSFTGTHRRYANKGSAGFVSTSSSGTFSRQTSVGKNLPGYLSSQGIASSRSSKSQLSITSASVPHKTGRTDRDPFLGVNRHSRGPGKGHTGHPSHSLKSKGPPCSVGGFYLIFPMSEATQRTAHGALDAQVVIKETQRLLKESIHSLEKNDKSGKLLGFLPYGSSPGMERLWGPVKVTEEEQ